MAVCPSCQSPQPDGAIFCDNCGAKLKAPQVALPVTAVMGPTPTVVASICPQCGSQTNPSSPFCDNCGASIAVSAAQTAGPQAPMPFTSPAPATGGMVCNNCGAQLQPGSAFCDMCGAPVSVSTSAVQPQYLSQAVYSQIKGRFVVQQSGAQLSFPLGKTEIVVGREDVASNFFPDIDLNDHGGDEGGVSRRHARISLRDGKYYIVDLGSVNFTFVNRQKLAPKQPHPLNDGDEVQLGRVKLNFYL